MTAKAQARLQAKRQAAAPPRRRRLFHHRAARHVGRGAHHVLRWLASFAAVLILVTLFGIWRLMQGPVQLDWLTPYVEAAIARSGLGVKVALSGVSLGIDRDTNQLGLRASNVRVSLPDGKPVARLPEVSTSIALAPLLRGELEPMQLVVDHPTLHLLRDAAGAITAQIEAGDAPVTDAPQPLVDELSALAAPGAPLRSLRRISIRNATVIIDDATTAQTWRLDRVAIAAARDPGGLSGDVSFAMPLGGSAPELYATYRYGAADQSFDLKMSVGGVRLSDLPPLVLEMTRLREIEAPMSGTLQARIKLAPRKLEGMRLDLALDKGQWVSPWLPAGVLAFDRGELSAVYVPENAELRVEKIALDLRWRRAGGGRWQHQRAHSGDCRRRRGAARDAPCRQGQFVAAAGAGRPV